MQEDFGWEDPAGNRHDAEIVHAILLPHFNAAGFEQPQEELPDSTFVTGIEFVIENKIIMISSVPSSNVSDDQIPDWIRNSAHWWSQDLISEDEFVESLKFLIREGIIIIK